MSWGLGQNWSHERNSVQGKWSVSGFKDRWVYGAGMQEVSKCWGEVDSQQVYGGRRNPFLNIQETSSSTWGYSPGHHLYFGLVGP